VAATQRKSREGAFRVALVGYTNAGKSSLMNALAGADLLVENQLFSTLDATTRRLPLPGGTHVLLTDTVGFIRKLPHDLVASFRTTLSEVTEADLLLHVVDITSDALATHVDTVHQVLDELLGAPRDTFMVFNKIDALEDDTTINVMLRHHPRALFVSARSGAGLQELRESIQSHLRARTVNVVLELRSDAADIISFCHREGRVQRQDAGADDLTRIHVHFRDTVFRRFRKLHGARVRVIDAPTHEDKSEEPPHEEKRA